MEAELQLLRVPLECLQVCCRQHQRSLDRDFLVVENAVKNLRLREKDNPNVQNTCGSIDKIVTKLRGVKRKLAEFDEAQQHQEALALRLRHLHQYNPLNARVFGDPYNTARVTRLIVDSLLRRGLLRTAVALAERHGIVALVDVGVFQASEAVVAGLRARRCTEALAWCKEHQARLRRRKSALELHLRQQEFAELALSGQRLAAVEYARKYLAPHASSSLDAVRRCMALLCVDPGAGGERYRDFVGGAGWGRLEAEFREEMLAAYQFGAHPLLHVLVQAGILALNTQQAYQPWSYNVNDPMCNALFQRLARKLPLTSRKNSALVCRVSGGVMDGNNPPMVLPNGQVYSLQTLEQMEESLGCIVCPATQERFKLQQAKKAFVL